MDQTTVCIERSVMASSFAVCSEFVLCVVPFIVVYC
jgi:hypothetical protein